jgi:endonuclease/exonuclease/phosphatase family metal-dependent hydrolase
MVNMKVLTYNVWSEGGDYDSRLEGILNIIKLENPDFIALQEVKYGSYDIIRETLSKWYCSVDRKVEFNRMYGEMLFSITKPICEEYIGFTSSPNIRGLTIYRFEGITLATTHLELTRKNNMSNCSEIIKLLDNKLSGNCFLLMGDFNFFEGYEGFNFTEIGSENTFESEKFNSRPDRIYYNELTPVKSIVIKNNLSDHYGLIGYFY